MIPLDVEKLIRPSISKLHAYQSARSLVSDARVFLDANEAPEGRFNRYPSPQPAALLERFSELYGVRGEAILMGRGSDEAIDTLTRALCEPQQDSVLVTPPTYGMYEVSAAIQNAKICQVPLRFSSDTWSLNTDQMISTARQENTKIIYVCSPNNPTGGVFALPQIRELCSAVNSDALVVVDEAYGEYAPEHSAVALTKEFSNLAVLRTLSKAWGLAGLRCGVVIADPSLIAVLQKVRAPYPLPQPVIDEALTWTSEEARVEMRARVQRTIAERSRLQLALRKSPLVETVFSSVANFILVRFFDADRVMRTTRSEGLILRSRTAERGLKNCIRITVGTEAENNTLLDLLGKSGRL